MIPRLLLVNRRRRCFLEASEVFAQIARIGSKIGRRARACAKPTPRYMCERMYPSGVSQAKISPKPDPERGGGEGGGRSKHECPMAQIRVTTVSAARRSRNRRFSRKSARSGSRVVCRIARCGDHVIGTTRCCATRHRVSHRVAPLIMPDTTRIYIYIYIYISGGGRGAPKRRAGRTWTRRRER